MTSEERIAEFARLEERIGNKEGLLIYLLALQESACTAEPLLVLREATP